MWPRIFIVLFVFWLPLLGANADPVEFLEGSSREERELRWLWKYLPEFVRSCLDTAPECADPELRPIIERVQAALPAKPESSQSAWGQRLKFVSESAHPDLFQTSESEAHRLAVTDTKPGVPIFINADRMSLDHIQWVGILAHEAVHNLGIKDGRSRLPDRVGAAISAHVERAIVRADLSEFGHPQAGLVFFSAPGGDLPARILTYFLHVSTDNSAGPNNRVPICARGEKFVGQRMQPPLWRVLDLRGDIGEAKIQGSALLWNRCASAARGEVRKVRSQFAIRVDLQFKEKFDERSAWWERPSLIRPDSLAAGVNDEGNQEMDLDRGFIVESIRFDEKSLKPEQSWNAAITVKALDDYVPRSCLAAFSGTRWHFNRTANLKMFQFFNSCTLTALDSDRWQVDTRFLFPPATRPDLFALAFIRFEDEHSNVRYALPARPEYVEIQNPRAATPLKVLSWNVVGLEPRTSLYGVSLVNSFQVRRGQPFWLEIYLQGQQEVKNPIFDFDFVVPASDGFVLMAWNPPMERIDGRIVLKTEQRKIPGGFILRYQLTLPDTVSGLRPEGFRLRRVSVETSDFSWTELNIWQPTEGYFLTDKL
ncbi:MAG: hypothetical protein AB7G93_08745 [Bdellovibrionales bacterium]